MQEEVTQKTIALVFKSSRLTADVLKKAMKMYLERRKAGQQATHGKMSVKKLVGQGMGASSIEVTDNNIKSFERVARKYNVDFAGLSTLFQTNFFRLFLRYCIGV